LPACDIFFINFSLHYYFIISNGAVLCVADEMFHNSSAAEKIGSLRGGCCILHTGANQHHLLGCC